MTPQYTISSAAAALSVSVSTVRRMADEFSQFLPDYQPLPGEARRLSADDVRTLSALLARLQASPGLTRSGLLRELSTGQGEPLVIPDTLPTRQPPSPPDSPGRAIDAIAIPDSPRDTQTAIQALSTIAADVARLHARIDGLQPQTAPAKAPDSLSLIAAAVAVGVLIGALVAAAVWQNSAAVVLCVGVALVAVLGSIYAPLRK